MSGGAPASAITVVSGTPLMPHVPQPRSRVEFAIACTTLISGRKEKLAECNECGVGQGGENEPGPEMTPTNGYHWIGNHLISLPRVGPAGGPRLRSGCRVSLIVVRMITQTTKGKDPWGTQLICGADALRRAIVHCGGMEA